MGVKLGKAGKALANEIAAWLKEQNITLDPHERSIAIQMCRTADRLEWLAQRIDNTSNQGTRVDLMKEERQQSMVLSRLVNAVGFPTGVLDATVATGGPNKGKVIGLDQTSRNRRAGQLRRWAEHQPRYNKSRPHLKRITGQ